MTTIIGLHGRKGAGKDTVGQMIRDQVGEGRCALISFADPIRRFVASLIGIHPESLTHQAVKEGKISWLNDVTPRHMMQTLGTEWGRNMIDPDLWIKMAAMQLRLYVAYDRPFVVFTDVRFPNEAEMIRNSFGTIIHIERPEKTLQDKHVSEIPLPRATEDLVIDNSGTVHDLRSTVRSVLGRWYSRP